MEGQTPTAIHPREDPLPAPDPARTADDILRAAEDLVPLLRQRAAEADESRRIEADTYRRLQEAGLFRILKPGKYGGLELSEHEHAKVTMTLARGCASTAWVFSILNSHNMAILSFPAQVHEEVWGQNAHATLAGNTNLNPKARAVRVSGGYRLTGSWGFCSGSDFTEWLFFNAPAGEDGESHMFLVPREDAVTIDDWFPTGMRATGSQTLVLDEVYAPPETYGGNFRQGLVGEAEWAAVLFGGVYLGLAEKAFIETREALKKKHLGATAGAQDTAIKQVGYVQHALGRMRYEIEVAARALEMTANMAIENRDLPSSVPARKAMWDTAKVVTTEAAISVTDQGLRLVGGASFRRGNVLERLFRDARAGILHSFSTDQLYDTFGRYEFGLLG